MVQLLDSLLDLPLDALDLVGLKLVLDTLVLDLLLLLKDLLTDRLLVFLPLVAQVLELPLYTRHLVLQNAHILTTQLLQFNKHLLLLLCCFLELLQLVGQLLLLLGGLVLARLSLLEGELKLVGISLDGLKLYHQVLDLSLLLLLELVDVELLLLLRNVLLLLRALLVLFLRPLGLMGLLRLVALLRLAAERLVHTGEAR